MKNVKLIVPIISLVCAAVVCGAVLLWAPVCAGTLELANGNMVPMRCAYTAKVAVLLALVLAAVAVAALVTKRPMTVALVLLSCAIVLMTFDTPLVRRRVQERRHGLPGHGPLAAHRRRRVSGSRPGRRPPQPRPQARSGVGRPSRSAASLPRCARLTITLFFDILLYHFGDREELL